MSDVKKPVSEMTQAEVFAELGLHGKPEDYQALGNVWSDLEKKRWYESDASSLSPAAKERDLQQFKDHLRGGGRYRTETTSRYQQDLYREAKLSVGVPAENKSPADVARQVQRQEARGQFFERISDVFDRIKNFFFGCRCPCHTNGTSATCLRCEPYHREEFLNK